MDASGLSRLTDRERAALRAYGESGSRQGAAYLLKKSESTIASQLASARRKLGASSSEQAVVLFMGEEGIHPSWMKPRWMIDDREPAVHPEASHSPGAVDVDGVREERAFFGQLPPDRHDADAKPEGSAHDPTILSAPALTLVIAAGLIFAIIAAPGLVDSFKRLTAWLLTFYEH